MSQAPNRPALDQNLLLDQLSQASVDELLGQAVRMRLDDHEVLADGRTPCQGIPLVVRGQLKVTQPTLLGHEILLYTLQPGDVCVRAVACALGQSGPNVRVVADGPTLVQLIPLEAMKSLLRRDPRFSEYVLRELLARQTALMNLVESVAFLPVDRRLARYLVDGPAERRTTHQAIADDLGTVREIVSRHLSKFADQGWVLLSRGLVRVTDAPALAKFADSSAV